MKTFIEKNTRTLRRIFPALNNCFLERSPIIINYVELAMTTKCTLCCEKCWHLMPYYLFHPVGLKKQGHIPFKKISTVIDKFLESVDIVENFCLLGGEPFLYPDLNKVVDKLNGHKKVKKIGIVTNGTLIPANKMLDSLKNEKVYFDISDYGEISHKKEELMELFEKNNIPFKLRNCYSEKWIDPGEPMFRNRSKKELEEIYSKCTVPLCQFILDGNFYMCPRAAHEVNLELHPRFGQEYVNLMQNCVSKKRKEIRNLLSRKYIESCNYCNGSHSDSRIPAATQLSAEDIKKLRKNFDNGVEGT